MSSVEPAFRSDPVHLAPAWALEAGAWLRVQSRWWRAVGIVLGLITLVFSIGLLLGGGYTSIQGVRVPLAWFGVPVATAGIPALAWWLQPAALIFVQIFGKRIPGLTVLYKPSLWYDGATNAMFFGVTFLNNLDFTQTPWWLDGALITTIIGSSVVLGVGLAVLAERAFCGALALVWAGLRSTTR